MELTVTMSLNRLVVFMDLLVVRLVRLLKMTILSLTQMIRQQQQEPYLTQQMNTQQQ